MMGPMGTRTARRGSDVTPFLEACYAESICDDTWAGDILAAFAEAFPSARAPTLTSFRCDLDADAVAPASGAGNADIVGIFSNGVAAWRLQDLRAFVYPPTLVSLQADAARHAAPEVMAYVCQRLSEFGVDNWVTLVVHPCADTTLVLWAAIDAAAAVSRHERGRLTRLALHLESGFRLRAEPGAVRAVMSADGTLVDGELTAGAHTRLAAAVRGAETTRSTRELATWSALVAGELSVVPRVRGSRRVYELVENPRETRPFRAFTKREVEVVELAARGLTSKLCAYGLGLSSSTISITLEHAATKLGAINRLELVRIAALLAGDPRCNAADQVLTRAENEILRLVREGLSNAEIAARRGRSIRTIANQVARLLEKTKAMSRRALLARDRSTH